MAFAGVEVLKGVDLDLFPGEVHGLIGENGAGKLTLGKLVAGVYRPTGGTISIGGEPRTLGSPRQAMDLGVALIHQEPLTFPDLDVAENIFVGRQPTKGPNQVDWKTMVARAGELLNSLGVSLDPRAKVRGLSVADQQMVELAAALSQNAKVLILDETTASLTPKEVAELFAIVRRLRDEGCAIGFVSHRLDEVFEICDRITVLRDGEKVGERIPAQSDIPEIIQMMVGREVVAPIASDNTSVGEVVLEVEGLCQGTIFQDIGFSVRSGEIVGMAGLVGAGRTDVARALFGITRPTAGAIKVGGAVVRIANPQEAIAHGLALVPEDRQHHGLLLPISIAENACLAILRSLSKASWVNRRQVESRAHEYAGKLRIAMRNVHQPVRDLSGGNQQKVVLSKWLMSKPRVLILDEPTRGIDVGAKAEVHKLMRELADGGLAILMISSDLQEVLSVSDRVLVMREGRLVRGFEQGQATQESVMLAEPVWRHMQPELVRKIATLREVGTVVLLIGVVAAALSKNHNFLDPKNIESILLWIPLLAVVGMGQMLVILTRGIDVSVGSMVGLSAMIVGILFRDHSGLNIYVGTAIGFSIGALLGAINGGLIAWARVPPIIATLGTLSAYRGLVFITSKGDQIDPNQIPDALTNWSLSGPITIHGVTIPWLLIWALVAASITAYMLKSTRTGRDIYAIGSHPEAARLRGIPVTRVTFLVYTICGALSGLAGVLYASRYGFVNPATAGQGFELTVIAAVVIGGTNVLGGSGTVLGVLLGCLLLGTINVALAVLGIDASWQMLVYGLVILFALVLDSMVRRWLGRIAVSA